MNRGQMRRLSGEMRLSRDQNRAAITSVTSIVGGPCVTSGRRCCKDGASSSTLRYRLGAGDCVCRSSGGNTGPHPEARPFGALWQRVTAS